MPEQKLLRGAEKKRAEIREKYWKKWREEHWVGDRYNPGWVIVPRTLELVATLIKKLKGKKDTDASRLYMNLWCRVFTDGVVPVGDERDLMFACGYTPNRGMRTWRRGLAQLEGLGFIIVVKPWGEDGGISHIILRNPDMVVQEVDGKDLLPDDWKRAYERRMTEIGAVKWKAKTRRKRPIVSLSVRRGALELSQN